MTTIKDYKGKTFGRLTAVEWKRGKGWLCNCLCGKSTIIPQYYLTQIKYPTCRKCNTRFEYPKEYKSWDSMKQRCLNPDSPDYPRYGGRGITIQEDWIIDFYYFLRDMGKRPELHTLDRVDVNGNYTKDNCRWANRYLQMNNMRVSKQFTPDDIIYTDNGYFR